MGNPTYSKTIRAGKNTYFVDVKEAKNKNKYLAISQTTQNGEEPKRFTLRIFSDSLTEFREAIDEAVASIAQS